MNMEDLWQLDPGKATDMLEEIFFRTIDNAYKDLGEVIKKMKKGLPRSATVYDVLGVNPSATEEEVRKAYREKAWKAHPDRGGSNVEMALLNKAYEMIKRHRGWK